MFDNLFWLIGPVFSSAVLFSLLGVLAIPAMDCKMSAAMQARRHARL
jgi:hypothetical protein